MKRDCPKRKGGASVSKAGQSSYHGKSTYGNENFTAMISEVNMIQDDNDWWVDSGATRHVCKDKSSFKTYEPVKENIFLYMDNKSQTDVLGKGSVLLEFTYRKSLILNYVYYAPVLSKNLMFGYRLNQHGFKQVFESGNLILSKGGIFVGKRYAHAGMFKLNLVCNTVVPMNEDISIYVLDTLDNSELFHNRLGHVNYKMLKDMAQLSLILSFYKKEVSCKTYMVTKITMLPFPAISIESKLLDLIHNDLCDLSDSLTIESYRYFVIFIDDYSRYCQVYLLKFKDEVLEKFKVIKSEVELHCETFIKCLRFDRGGEYYNLVFFQSCGLVHQVSARYTP
ncbi:hypothetical protein LIER_07922 [Lithospermum erythrorhizon]|uniref:Integrase catalytic domain-containing protein n=1 Tax=Lithospermum erythrorhizon TaxID=34254 RepID=A0AAV3PBL9_LITER